MAIEDFLADYTKTDPNAHITVTAPRCEFAGMVESGDVCFVWKNFGAGHFTDFIHWFDVRIVGHVGWGVLGWCHYVAEAADTWEGTNGPKLGCALKDGDDGLIQVRLAERQGGANDFDSYACNVGQTYYCVLEKSGVGAILKVYLEAARTTLLSTLVLVIVDNTYQFSHGCGAWEAGAGADTIDGWCENLDLSPGDGVAAMPYNVGARATMMAR